MQMWIGFVDTTIGRTAIAGTGKDVSVIILERMTNHFAQIGSIVSVKPLLSTSKKICLQKFSQSFLS